MMNLYSLLTKEASTFVSTISNKGNSRKLIVSLVIAKLVSDKIELPTTEVEDPASFYKSTYGYSVMQVVNSLNEVLVLDLPTINKLIENFYAARYSILHPCSINVLYANNPVEDFFGITKHISNDNIDLIKDNYLEVMELQLGFSKLITCLEKVKQVGE